MVQKKQSSERRKHNRDQDRQQCVNHETNFRNCIMLWVTSIFTFELNLSPVAVVNYLKTK